jgi:LPS export ABC transporter permease LptG
MLIDRYVFRELAAPTLLGLLVFTSLFLVQQFFRLADAWAKGSMDLPDLGLALCYILPSLLAQTIPMSLLLGVLIGFSRLSADAEITALRAAGIAWYRLLVPTMLVASIAWGASAAVYLKLVPWGNGAFVELMRTTSQRMDFTREITPGSWVGLEGAHVHARALDVSDPDNPWLLDLDLVLGERGSPQKEHLRASRGRISRVAVQGGAARLALYLEDVESVRWDRGEKQAVRSRQQVVQRQLKERRVPGLEGPAARRIGRKQARQQSLGELQARLVDLKEMAAIDALYLKDPKEGAVLKREWSMKGRWVALQQRERVRRETLMEVHKKFSIPMACFVFGLAGMPLGIASRRGGRPAALVISLGVIALWYVIYALGDAGMRSGTFSPIAAAWLPDLGVAIVGVFLLHRLRHQQGMGLYRWVRDGLLLLALLSLAFTGALVLGRLGLGAMEVPPWDSSALTAPACGLLFFSLYFLVKKKRDLVAGALARFIDVFRQRGEANVSSGSAAARRTAAAGPTGAEQPALQTTLERLRAGLVFGFLALLVFGGLQVLQDPDGLRAGASAVLFSWQGPALAFSLLSLVFLQRRGVLVLRTLDAWVLSSFLKYLIYVQAAMLMLFSMGRYMAMAPDLVKNDIPFSVFGTYLWVFLPHMLSHTIPLGTMLAALISLGIMAKHNETTAIRCGGTSLFRLVLPILFCATLISVFMFVLNDQVLPAANHQAEDLRDQIAGKPRVARSSSSHFVYAQDQRSLYVFDRFVVPHAKAGLEEKAQFLGLTVLRSDSVGRIVDVIDVRTAAWNGRSWTLRAGWRATFVDEETVQHDDFREMELAAMEAPGYFEAERANPDELTFPEYRRYIAAQESAGYPTGAMHVKLQRRVAFPAATAVLVLLGLPFGFRVGRRGALYSVGVAVILGLAYYIAMAFFEKLGLAEYLPPVMAAWAPNLLFTLAGSWLFLDIKT